MAAPTFKYTPAAAHIVRVNQKLRIKLDGVKNQAGSGALVATADVSGPGATVSIDSSGAQPVAVITGVTATTTALTLNFHLNDPDATTTTVSASLTVMAAHIMPNLGALGTPLMLGFNLDQSHVPTAAGIGLNAAGSSRPDENGVSQSAADGYRAALVSAGMYHATIPGYKYNETASNTYNDMTSALPSFVTDAKWTILPAIDEFQTADRIINGTSGQRRQSASEWNAVKAATKTALTNAGRANITTYVNWSFGIPSKTDDVAYLGDPLQSTDSYWALGYYGRLIGTVGSPAESVIGGGRPFTTTFSGIFARRMCMLPQYVPTDGPAVANASFGAGWISYLQFGSIGDVSHTNHAHGPEPTPAEDMCEAMSALRHNGIGICTFQTYVGDIEFITWNEDSAFNTVIGEYKRRFAIMHALGALFKADGTVTRRVVRYSAASTGNNTSNAPTSIAKGASWSTPLPAGQYDEAQHQGGFESARFYNEAESHSWILVSNITDDPLTLNDTQYGISGMSFSALGDKLFADTDTAFSNNLFTVSGWASHLGQVIGTIINLPPNCTFSDEGRDIADGELTASSDGKTIYYGGTVPTIGDGHSGSGGLYFVLRAHHNDGTPDTLYNIYGTVTA